jgi:Fur family transcriptional regulator, ferric uptake regulator
MADDWSEQALAALEQGGKRSTVRRAVVEKLAEQSCAVTAADLASLLSADGRAVGRATVYRVLEGLRELRLVQCLDLGRDGTRYEPARAEDHHHHFVCDSCGGIVPFSDAGLERAIDRLARQTSFDVAGHDVVLHGACGRCER